MGEGFVIEQKGPTGWYIIGAGGLIGLALCIIGLALFNLATWAGWAMVIYAGGQSVACVCVGVARIVEARGRAASLMIGEAARADMRALWGEVEDGRKGS